MLIPWLQQARLVVGIYNLEIVNLIEIFLSEFNLPKG